MEASELKTVAVDKTVDARGTSCPGPLLAAKKEIAGISSGQSWRFFLPTKVPKGISRSGPRRKDMITWV